MEILIEIEASYNETPLEVAKLVEYLLQNHLKDKKVWDENEQIEKVEPRKITVTSIA